MNEPVPNDPRPARRLLLQALLATPAASLLAPSAARAQPAEREARPARKPDVVFVPTPQEVVDEMLRLAEVGPRDVLWDLGCGDGRIPVTAAKRFGTRATGVDIDPERIREARANARAAGVTDKVRFIQGDLFRQDLSGATVVTLYLLSSLNLRLRPKLLALRPGTRIVSHAFDMGDWAPEQTVTVGSSTVHLWRVPARGG